MVEQARELLDRVGAAFVVANDASVMGRDDTRVLVVRTHAVREFAGSKAALGTVVAEELAAALG
jgi:phosphopantothenoylcysteine decarboxylase/phosphopantothenate--cysteine ligase